MADNFVHSVVNFYKAKKWREIVNLYHDYLDRNKILWVFPAEENFEFLREKLFELNCDSILSIGCGTGLLEWMITEATGIPVSGVEVDGAWWHCKYAPPTFIPLILTSDSLSRKVVDRLKESQSTAILFCYFNNGPAFWEYMRLYEGSVLVIIGPGDGKAVHTDPMPFQDMGDEWELFAYQEIRNSKDFVAIYSRNRKLEVHQD